MIATIQSLDFSQDEKKKNRLSYGEIKNCKGGKGSGKEDEEYKSFLSRVDFAQSDPVLLAEVINDRCVKRAEKPIGQSNLLLLILLEK